MVLEHMVVWGKRWQGYQGSFCNVGTGYVYLAPFCKWSRDEPLFHLKRGQYFAQGKPIKAYTNDLEKRPNKGVLSIVLDNDEV